VKPQTPAEVPYTAPVAKIPLKIGFVQPFPEGRPKNEIEAASMWNLAAQAYAQCILMLTDAKKQDEIKSGQK
jgi:hypothetical protein